MRRLGLAALALFVLASCKPPDDGANARTDGAASDAPRIAFVTNGVAAFWTIAKKGAEDAGDATGARVSVHMPPRHHRAEAGSRRPRHP